MIRKNKWLVSLLILVFCTVIVAGCNGGATEQQGETGAELEGELVFFHAGSLSIPFEALEKEFERQHPKVDIQRTAGGSTALAREIIDLGTKVDIFASADYLIIDDLIPENAEWNALFANNALVIMYTDQSKYADEINSDNWYEILLREDVNYGHSNPNDDPCGYRSVLSWQLAEQVYEEPGLYQKLRDNCPPENIRPKSVELISLLETGTLDYAFEYESVALQHAQANPEFQWVDLPDTVGMDNIEHADFYKTATLETAGSEPGQTVLREGSPIVYGITMPKTGVNNEIALEFLKFFFDKDQGLKILKENGQPVPDEIVVRGDNFPKELSALLK